MSPRPKSQEIFSVELKNDSQTTMNQKETSFEDTLKMIGFGKIQYIVIILSGLVLMAVLNETMGMMIIIPAAQCDLKLTAADKGIIGAMGFLGIIVSSHLWGYLADTKGRRKVIIYTIFASNLCTILSCFINNVWIFAGIRFLTGFFVSGPSGAVYAYLGEYNRAKNRTPIISWACLFVGFSSMYVAGAGYLVLRANWAIPLFGDMVLRPWRLLMLVMSFPGFFGAFFMLFFKETPKFLLSQGRDEEALEVLRWMNKHNNGPKSVLPVEKLISEVNEIHLEKMKAISGGWSIMSSVWTQTVPLFKPPHLIYMLACCFLQYGFFFATSGLGLWYPDILNRLTIDTNSTTFGSICQVLAYTKQNNNITSIDDLVCDDTITDISFIATFILGVSFCVCYMIVASVMHKLGRGTVVAGSLLFSGLCGLGLNWMVDPIGIVLLFLGFILLSGINITIINGAAVELFPTHLRAMAVCIVLMIGRLGGVSGTNFVGALLDVNCEVTFMVFTGMIFACAAISFILPCR